MPDWITHIVVAWTLCTLLSFKFKQFNNENIVIVLIGALIPDIFKINMPLNILGIHTSTFIAPIHMPIGSLIIAAIISLFFNEKKMTFIFLVLGISTHFALDLLLINVNGGMMLLFPFSWATWQLGIIPIDDYNTMILAIILAIIVYIVSVYKKRKKSVKKLWN